MSEEIKTEQELLDAFADNSSGLITERDIRNFVVSAYDEISKAGMEPAYCTFEGRSEWFHTTGVAGVYRYEGWDHVGLNANITPSTATHKVVPSIPGIYRLHVIAPQSHDSTGGHTIYQEIRVNGISALTTRDINTIGSSTSDARYNQGGDGFVYSTILNLSSGDEIELWFNHSLTSRTVTFMGVYLTLVRLA